MITERDTLEKTWIHVICVRNVFQLRVACVIIWIFIEVNTSAQNVANVVTVFISWQHTDEVIQERNHLNVLFVADDLHWLDTLLDTAEFTVERNHTSVHCVTNVSANPTTCSVINIVYTATEDCITVHIVGSSLRQTLNWSIMFVFTLTQSRTHVDTVQTVLECFTNSSDICWSHTMNVLRWNLTLIVLERNRLNVLFVANDLHGLETLLDTAEFTVERNHTSVHCVTNASLTPATCSIINVLCTATVDHVTVLTVGSCLRQTLNWSIMFVFTLMQSRTHVDTVQTVLQHFTNSRNIYWSHTMNVLRSNFTLVIHEWKHLNVPFVANDLHRLDTLLDTAEFTVERNHTNVACVTKHLVSLGL